ncbi:MAG: glutamate 5-kinase [Bacteroidales bacterium]|jgi:glutamate 5-kinase|nr:glutamate 5-kinase [Bacteroidales bacterium]
MINSRYKRIAVKIGSNVLAGNEKGLDLARIEHLVNQISIIMKGGTEIILVSSGAVAAGRSIYYGHSSEHTKIDTVSARQLWSALGQVELMNTYYDLFSRRGILCGQVLTTKENFSDRRHYLNMKNCISAMLDNGVVPIINENDTISVTELMFTDNDELSGLISSMMGCEALILLTNVDGIFKNGPSDIIREISASDRNYEKFIYSGKSEFGRGGMRTKYSIARQAAREGMDVFIANGKKNDIISDIVSGKDVPRTRFEHGNDNMTGSKKWLAHSESFAKGVVTVNQGAAEALKDIHANSLLLIGVTDIKGYFKKGDLISIEDENGNHLGLGKSQYDSESAHNLIGKKAPRPLIHYDYMFLD